MAETENETIKELFNYPAQEFKKHLQLPGNSRIIFSGKFGKGKSTFIDYFFKNQKEYFEPEKYEAFFVSPVNYSIASNEDIIGYIKYDILLEFLRKGFQLELNDFKIVDVLPSYLKKNPLKVVSKLLTFIPIVGKEIDDVYKKVETLYNEVKVYQDGLNSKADSEIATKFIEEIEISKGSIYENDITTKLIEKILSSNKKTKNQNAKDNRERKEINQTENVLIIDDLDRIDPEHTFRILNVFSAHFDNYLSKGKTNKFGFDKIIIVCDINNIRNIFKNRYGIDVDFNGYVDKFYSKEVFHFQNHESVRAFSKEILKRVTFSYKVTPRESVKYSLTEMQATKSLLISLLLENLIYYDLVSLRTLLSIINRNESFDIGHIVTGAPRSIPFKETSIPFEIKFLSLILGGYKGLIEKIEFLERLNITFEDQERCCNALLWVLVKSQDWVGGSELTTNIVWGEKVLVIKIRHNSSIIDISYNSTNSETVPYKFERLDYYIAIKKVAELLYRVKFIQ